MSNTQQTKQEIDEWLAIDNKRNRYDLLDKLAQKAGIVTEFRQIPIGHWEKMDYDRYWMNVLAMSKIRELRQVGLRP